MKDLFLFHQSINPRFTYRCFSLRAKLSSPSALKEVIDGKKNLSEKSILQFSTAFKLNKGETDYFAHLVRFNQSTSEAERNHHYQELLKLKQTKKGKTLTSQQYQYYTNWYNSAIRELVGTVGFKNEPEWIARRLIPNITPIEVEKAVELLINLGLLIKNPDNTFKQDSPKLEIDPDVTTLAIRNFNRNMIHLGSESIERFPQDTREVSGLTLGVSRNTAMEIKTMIRDFKKQLLNIAVNDTQPSEEVYQLNFQFFPLTQQESI